MYNLGDIRFKILVVDDIPENIQIIINFLRKLNLDISFATSGVQCLKMLTNKKADLILLDVQMPEMDGFEVCRRLKINVSTADIPVIFLTANNLQESIVNGFEVGGVDYITKPFNQQELIKRIYTHLELKYSKDLVNSQNELLQKQVEELKELNATKDKFFSIIAHDLKNPFNALIGFSEMLLSYHDIKDAEQREIIELIHGTSKQTFSLLENLLIWARSQSGKLTYKPEILSLNELLIQNYQLLNKTAQQKNITLSIPNVAIEVYADINMINTVIRNLISNAIKFTPYNGNINITTKINEKYVYIAVNDTGVGIPAEDLNKLFRMDINYSKPGTNSEQGTGLGLLLCKDFVEKNGGTITVESEENKGSTFTFSLPLALS